MKKLLLLIPLLFACKSNNDFLEYVNLCAKIQFAIDYENSEIVMSYTEEIESYYLSNIYYRIEFENDIYKTEYLSSLNDKNELIMREVHL